MNAVERALRHIEQLQKRLIKAMPPQTKSKKEKLAPKRPTKSRRLTNARPVKKRARKSNPRFVPPVTQPDVSELEQTFAPAPTPPDVEGPISPAFPLIGEGFDAMHREQGIEPVKLTRPAWADAWERAHPSGTPPEAPKVAPAPAQAVSRGSCKAIDADTGRTCKLLAGHDGAHATERGPFTRVLQPGAVPLLHQRLDTYATRREAPEMLQTRGAAQEKRESRARRKSAHAGDATSTGLTSIDRSLKSAEGGEAHG